MQQLFEKQVLKTPNRIAIEFAGEQLTYQQLNQRANQLAHHLQSLGVEADVLVGIYVERSPQLIIAILATLKAGGAYLPLDPNYPAERLAFMLANSQTSVVLTQSHLTNSLPLQTQHCLCLDNQNFTSYPTTNPQTDTTPDHLAYVIYTSGSTGQPKGVAMPHRPLVNLIAWQSQTSTIDPHNRTLQYTPISFDVSFQETFATLTTGGTLVLITDETRRNPSSLLQFLQQQSINRLFLPFVALQQLAEVVRLEGTIPSSLQEVITAGEQLRITQAIAHLFTHLPNCTLHNHYGPSETHVVSAYSLTGSPQDWAVLPPIGQAIANSQIYLLDTQLQPVGVGMVGELYVGGMSLARGYLNRPDLTSQRFIVSASGERLYKTGDLARYLANGNLEYWGRIDEQVKIRGYRIEPGEIEAVLEGHSLVRRAVVVARADITDGRCLVAYLLVDTAIGEGELRQFLRRHLPEYMIPTAFVLLAQFPLTPSGKVDRHALPAPQHSRPELKVEFVPPRTKSEELLAYLWTQNLGIPQIGIHDNFFELGGYSLKAVQLVAKIQETFKVNLPLRSFFEAPTIAQLAKLIADQQAGTSILSLINPVIDLNAEAVLDPAINPQNTSTEILDEPTNVLLTGATGFLGGFLLHQVLTQSSANIYCLVRAKSLPAGLLRLQSNLAQYSLWDENNSHRIIPVIGDLAQPLLGLSADEFQNLATKIDVIYHNGGLVNFVYPYSVLKAPNVLGTQEILRLASQTKVKPVHFISTVDVFSPIAYPETQVILEQEANRDQGLYGYTQSKWVAEKLVNIAQQRGIPTNIYRPTWIEGHSQTGICNHTDFFRSLIKGCIQLGLAPDWHIPVDIIPVDYISRAIIYLSRKKSLDHRIFHLSNPQSISWNQLVTWIQQFGYPLQQISFKDWLSKVMFLVPSQPENALYPFLNFLSDKVSEQQSIPELYFQSKPVKFDCQNTLDGLTDTNITCPPVNAQLLNTYFSYFIQSGFLEP